MVKTVPICFTNRTNSKNAYHKLDAGRSLLAFSEFDFTFFWEQSIEAGRQGKRTGSLPKTTVDNARAAIAKAHPLIAAGINTDYADIVLDCIIAYITKSERLTEDELWMRCITGKNHYEAAIFARISQYKTFRGTNQWTNIYGLQKYAKDKIAFVYGRTNDERITAARANTFKQYFDLAFTIAANECSLPKNAQPAVKIYNPFLSPSAPFAVNTSVSKTLYKRMEESLADAPDRSGYEKNNSVFIEDRLALECYSFAEGLERPKEPDEELFRASMDGMPDRIYEVTSLKAVIDLEFDIMCETGVHLKKCETCGRYFLIDSTGFGERFCDRVGSSGKTCRRSYEELCEAIVETRPMPPKVPLSAVGPSTKPPISPSAEDPSAEDPPAENPTAEVVDKTEFFPDTGEMVHIKYSAPVREFPPTDIPDEDEKHCQRLYNSIYKRVGKSLSEHEFREWSQYLSNMKRNVKTGEGSLEQLRQFLAYSDKLSDEIKLAARQKRIIPKEPVERLNRFARETDNMHNIGDIPFPSYAEGGVATEPLTEVIHVKDQTDTIEAVKFTPVSFDSAVADLNRTLSTAFKVKDAVNTEIDGRKVTISSPVWETVKRGEQDKRGDRGGDST